MSRRMAYQKLEETSVACPSLQDYNVFIVGYKGHGKSATMMNIIRDVEYKGAAGYKIEERTHEKCTFYDTPGFGSLDTTDSHVLRVINAKANAVGEVHALLFVLRYSRITSSVISLIRQLKDAFGPDYPKRTIIVFTFTNHEADLKLADYLNDSPPEFQKFVGLCEGRVIMLENSDFQTGETAASQIVDMITNRMHSEPLVVPWSRLNACLWACLDLVVFVISSSWQGLCHLYRVVVECCGDVISSSWRGLCHLYRVVVGRR
ncbi:GTPase IMAP family member 2 [Lingula anatina]|uniref:GTPase IMAP family member 2 n=1 Tax=Lingula anatina TaxID=7574 RepID=A0A1S3K833_LINAN|nr:GTPase IMAP family member 2 [Lingula anatina]|eukprot:XP_013418795.1 GTPase IMAP family member 2 [Lingula anatina]